MSTNRPGHESSPLRPNRRGFLAAPGTAFADTADFAKGWPSGPGQLIRPQAPDRELQEILRSLDRNRIRATVAKLTTFGTRHTLSSQTDPVRGIGAARDWLLAEMTANAAPSNGQMTVALQSYVQPPASRIPTPTTITNVVATLHGSVTPDRIYVVSGHYDS